MDVHRVTVYTATVHGPGLNLGLIFATGILKFVNSLTANLRKCKAIIFFVVCWETDSLRFMRLHNCWVVKQFFFGNSKRAM